MKHRERVLSKRAPVARSILWKPIDDSYHLLVSMLRQPADNYELFITQRCLRSVESQSGAAVDQEVFGLLSGQLYKCPKLEMRYLVAERAVPVHTPVREDGGRVAREGTREALEAALHGQKGETLGWYCRRSTIGMRLAPADEQLHVEFFGQAWQMVLVLAPSAERSTGAFFQYDVKAGRSCAIPFYELPDSAPGKLPTQKCTVIDWSNYVTSEAVTLVRAAKGEDDPPVAPGEPDGNGWRSLDGALSQLRHWLGGGGATNVPQER